MQARLATVVVGNPADRAVRMGALASLDQREEVRRSLKALEDAATIVFGDPEHVEVHRRRRRPRRVHVARCCCAPTARTAPSRTRSRRSARSRTLLPYTSARAGHRAGRARPGQPGRVGRHRGPRLRPRRRAGHSRRGTAGCSSSTTEDATESTGHGSPLPMLVHGGPGRAGGGEEMGGMRGVLHHMQRTAVQASPADAGRGHRPLGHGRAARPRTPHPFRKSLSRAADRRHGVAGPRTVTLDDIDALRRVHRRHVLRAHRRGGRGREPVLRRARRARLPGRVARRGPVRRARARPGAGQLRPREPALPHPGQARATS